MTNREFLKKQLEAEEAGGGYVLVSVADSDGSTPRSDGRMLVTGGATFGTIGGGAIELAATEYAVGLIGTSENQLITYNLAELGMSCGGRMSLLYQCFPASQTLLICGGGHISEKLAALAKIAGFRVIVADNREKESISSCLEHCDRFISLNDYYSDLRTAGLPSGLYIVIATYGHEHDGDALAAALETDARYIGMVGSSKKIGKIFDALIAKGYSETQISKVYSPIGLDLGGQTPEEIALSILAELQLIKNGGTGRHLRDVKRS